jgi:hypothetical protein
MGQNKIILTDCPELTDILLPKSIVSVIHENDDLLEEFIITDQHEKKPELYVFIRSV